MYNYKKKLPKGFKVEKEITEGSSAKIFILVNNENKRIVRKMSDKEGINNNGRKKLKKEIEFIKYFYNTKSSKIYPKIYNYEENENYVFYDMEFIEGKTLTELFEEKRKYEIIDCYNKVLNDLCSYSEIQFIKDSIENDLLYDFYIDKTQNVICKLLNENMFENQLVQSENLIINNVVYKNPRTIIGLLEKNEVKNKLKSNVKSICFHGDLISSNIIYNNGNVTYIDPRGEFSNFDIFYDIAKMKFSVSGYDQISKNRFELKHSGNSINFEIKDDMHTLINRYFNILLKENKMFSNYIIKQEEHWEERVKMHIALQYINNSYIQIKKKEIDKFKIIYSIGTIKLNELINELYE